MVEQAQISSNLGGNHAEASIRFSEIAELEKPLQRIIEGILRSGNTYDLIIGDDTSGRIPTLVLGKFLNYHYRASGRSPIPIRFVGGGRFSTDLRSGELEVIRTRMNYQPIRALLVTDYIDCGSTARDFGNYFKANDISYDVASIALRMNESVYRETKVLPNGVDFYFGESYDPTIHKKPYLTGLNRARTLGERVIRDGPAFGRKVREARQDVNVLVQRLISHFSSEPTLH